MTEAWTPGLRRVHFIGAYRPDIIVREALCTIGMDFDELKSMAEINYPSVEAIPYRNLGVYEWWRICKALYLSLDCIFIGFNRGALRYAVAEAYRAGRLTLRMTPEVHALLEENERECTFKLSRFSVNDSLQG